jgi:hypothetical protein
MDPNALMSLVKFYFSSTYDFCSVPLSHGSFLIIFPCVHFYIVAMPTYRNKNWKQKSDSSESESESVYESDIKKPRLSKRVDAPQHTMKHSGTKSPNVIVVPKGTPLDVVVKNLHEGHKKKLEATNSSNSSSKNKG